MQDPAAMELGNAKTALLAALGLFGLYYIGLFAWGLKNGKGADGKGNTPTPLGLVVGFVTNFFDTLGIGSYAPTTAMFKFTKIVPDEKIPGTLNVGHTIPTVIEAFLFTQLVQVDAKTLVLMIAAAVAGAWLGAGFVASWSRRRVQLGMGFALIVAAILFTIKNVDAMRATPMFPGGTALALAGTLLGVGIAVNFALGALMTIGIGMYAPCLILISMLGMNPIAAFPIMMGSCAFLMPVANGPFIRKNAFNARAALGLMIGGIPGVLVAYYLVKSLDVTTVRWGVVIVVLYTSIMMLRSAAQERAQAAGSVTL
jgi:uncharacterized membrane protein YfcA